MMQAAIDRVMQTYRLMLPLSEACQSEIRQRVEAHLAGVEGDEKALAIEGLRYLRNASHPTGREASAANV
jgi:hypothetical protein